MKSKKIIKKVKKQVKRNYFNSVSSNNNCFINFSSGSNKPNNRAKWNIYKSTGGSRFIYK